MYCPYCRHSDSRVIDSRTADDGAAIRRRRSCPACGRRFTTQETVILMVAKRSGVTEPFNRDKIVRGRAAGLPGHGRSPRTSSRSWPSGWRTRSGAAAAARFPRMRWAWRSWGRFASWTRSPTCASPPSTGASSRWRTSRTRSPRCGPNATRWRGEHERPRSAPRTRSCRSAAQRSRGSAQRPGQPRDQRRRNHRAWPGPRRDPDGSLKGENMTETTASGSAQDGAGGAQGAHHAPYPHPRGRPSL